MRVKPRILERRTVAQTRIFRVEQMDLQFANGTLAQYERIMGAGGGAVLVVPMLDADTVLLIREYAAGTDRYELGLPKGKVEEEESLFDAANREIMEEVGYGARRLRHIASLSLAPGYIAYHTHVILAEELYPRREEGDEPEEIEVVPWRLSELWDLTQQDDFTEARSLAALFMVRETLLNDLHD